MARNAVGPKRRRRFLLSPPDASYTLASQSFLSAAGYPGSRPVEVYALPISAVFRPNVLRTKKWPGIALAGGGDPYNQIASPKRFVTLWVIDWRLT